MPHEDGLQCSGSQNQLVVRLVARSPANIKGGEKDNGGRN